MITSFFRNLSVRGKVIAAFATVLIATTALGLFATQRMAAVNEHAEAIKMNWLPSTSYLGKMSYTAARIRQKQASVLMHVNDADVAQETADIEYLEADFQKMASEAAMPARFRPRAIAEFLMVRPPRVAG